MQNFFIYLNCYVKLSAIKILCTWSYRKIGSRKLCKNEGASEVDVEMEEAEKNALAKRQ